MSPLRACLLAVVAAVLMAACAKEPPAGTPPHAATAAPQAKKAVKAQGAQAAAAPAPPAFVYDPTGLRDPFEPFIKLEEKKPQAPKAFVPRTPLQAFPIEQLKLVGIVWGEAGKGRALIEDPQGKGYMVGVGTQIGDRGGKIVRMQPDRIVIEERFTDLFGEEKKTVANMTLRKSEGEVGP